MVFPRLHPKFTEESKKNKSIKTITQQRKKYGLKKKKKNNVDKDYDHEERLPKLHCLKLTGAARVTYKDIQKGKENTSGHIMIST